MTDADDGHVWRLRPGILTERWIRWGMFLLGMSLGAMGFLWQTDAGPRMGLAPLYWPIPTLLVSLLLAFPVATRLIDLLERRGVFGRVRLEGGRLAAKGTSFDLARPLQLDARRQAVTIKQYYSGAFRSSAGYRRTRRGRDLHVFALCVQLRQDDRTVTLYCAMTGEKGLPDIDGLHLRDLGFPAPQGQRFRLAPADLTDLLRTLRAEAAQARNQAMTSDAAPPAKLRGEDPRRLFAPRTKMIAGAMVILAVLAVGPVLVGRHVMQAASVRESEEEVHRAREYAKYEKQMKPMLGRWVHTSWAFKKGYYGYGWVKGYSIDDWWQRTPIDQWYPSYTVVLDRICREETNEALPPDETVWHNGRDVKKGDEISVSAGHVTPEAPPPGVTPPAGIRPATAPAPRSRE